MKVDIRVTAPYPIQWVTPQGWGYLRTNPWFWVFWFIPPLLTVAYLQPTSFIDWIFSGLSKVGVTLFQTWWSTLGLSLGGFRVWKLNRTYPDEKPPPFSFPMQGCCFVTRKPSRHLLAIPNISVKMEALYKVSMTRSVPPVQDLIQHLSQ